MTPLHAMGKSQVPIRVNEVLLSAFGVVGSAHFLELIFVREDTIFHFAAFGYPTATGDVEFDGTSRVARSAPVCPADMIFWSIMGEITGCFEEIQGV